MVDARYFFAAGSALVGGGERLKRSLITLDEAATVTALKKLASGATGKPLLLRIYWYDGASARLGPSAEHPRIAHCNDVKLRLGFLNAAGQQRGVDSLIVTDLVDLAEAVVGAAQANDFDTSLNKYDSLVKTCRSCHDVYKPPDI